MDGILLVDKPAGPTSHDVVARARTILGETKIGHAGTLDPPATGLLVLALGRALRILRYMEGHEKEYEFSLRFGRATDTDDASGGTLHETDASGLERPVVEAALERFRGEIRQQPPRVSAVKVGGRRLHEAARRGEALEAPPRTVRIHDLALRTWSPPLAEFRMRCSKGTYVRSLARDLGEVLGVGACVERLRRLVSGPFRVEDSLPPDRPREEFERALLPMDAGLLHLAEARLTTEESELVRQGRPVPRCAAVGGMRLYVGPRFLGVGESDGTSIRPRTVLIG